MKKKRRKKRRRARHIVKIIETNLLCTNEGVIKNHQSRIIEANDWQEYCKAFVDYNGEPVEFSCLIGLKGETISEETDIYNLDFDEFHLSCNTRCDSKSITKLAYLIEEPVN